MNWRWRQLFRQRGRGGGIGADPNLEFGADGPGREASDFDLSARSADWMHRIGRAASATTAERALALPEFHLIRTGDHFEASPGQARARTDAATLSAYAKERLCFSSALPAAQRAALEKALLSVLSGHPALCRRMLLAKPIDVALVSEAVSFRALGFPPHTNERALGVFWNQRSTPLAKLAIRVEAFSLRPWIAVHEMMHAVYFLALTEAERASIQDLLLPVYRDRRWVEEAVAVYAERAMGATYLPEDLDAPPPYGPIRRDWRKNQVFAHFMEKLLRPQSVTMALE